jgi:hypothetical protein
MPLTLPANGGQSAVQAVAVVPEESVAALVDLAGPLLGVDHEQPAWADDEVVDVGGGARNGQVVQDLATVAAEAVEQPRGLLFAVGAALPGAGLLGGAEAQPPAG